MAALIVFVSFIAIVFMSGYHWRKVSVENAVPDRHDVRVSLLSKL